VPLAVWLAAVGFCLPGLAGGQGDGGSSPYARWTNGPSADPGYFPIAVWLQSPRNAGRFKEAGINLYVGLWRGPTREQLDELEAAGMPVVCAQNRFALENKASPVIVGWMHGDEPDNAQARRESEGGGYGPPVLPEKVVADFERMRAADPTRPVFLNLGQGVAYDDYIGRGVRRNRPEDYPEYLKGCDIASFDIYPAVHDEPEVAGKLEFVARGVERLVRWTGGQKPVWNCIECTHIGNPAAKATPDQVRSEVWMSLVHGSRGLVYFVHQFEPSFNEAALLDDPEMLAAVTAINAQVRELAPVLNSPSVGEGVSVDGTAEAGQVAWMKKRHAGHDYLFTVNMRNSPTGATFTLQGLPPGASGEVLGEGRNVELVGESFSDEFAPYQVHLYRFGKRSR
jgi:hypothetical protein